MICEHKTGGLPHIFTDDPWMGGEFIPDEQTLRPYINENSEVPEEIPERDHISYECRTLCAIPEQLLLDLIRVRSFERWKVRCVGRSEPCKGFSCVVKYIAFFVSLLSGLWICQLTNIHEPVQ